MLELDKMSQNSMTCHSKQHKNFIASTASLNWHHKVWVIDISIFAQKWLWWWGCCCQCSNWDYNIPQNVYDSLSPWNKWDQVFELARSKASAPQEMEEVFPQSCKGHYLEQLSLAQPFDVLHFSW